MNTGLCKKKRINIAIDGPAAAGKSTVAALLAREMGYTFLNTGAMYRALAIVAIDRDIALDDLRALADMAGSVTLCVKDDGGMFRVWADGVEVTDRLKQPGTDKAVKLLAMIRPVREVLVALFRQMAQSGGLIMEGRDIGSVVIPDARAKVFLTATPEERATRRFRELRQKGIDLSWAEVLDEMKERDKKDLERPWGKLVQVEGSLYVDSTQMTICQVYAEIRAFCEEKMAECISC